MVVGRRSLEVDVSVRQHPDRPVRVLRLELQVSAVLEVHQHRVVVAVVVVGVVGGSLLLLLLRLAGLALAGGALCPPRLHDNNSEQGTEGVTGGLVSVGTWGSVWALAPLGVVQVESRSLSSAGHGAEKDGMHRI